MIGLNTLVPVLFVIVGLVLIVWALISYVSTSKNQSTSVPGLAPSSAETGNLSDVAQTGSLHEFLVGLHKTFGSIASFWWGSQYTVSIASPKLFKDYPHVFDRPPLLFKLFEPFFGPRSIQYANGEDGTRRRHNYDRFISHDYVRRYFEPFQEVGNLIQEQWYAKGDEDHILLQTEMATYALKSVLTTLFGKTFQDDKQVLEFKAHYDVCWGEMEKRLVDVPDKNSSREKSFQESLAFLKEAIRKVVENRKQEQDLDGRELLVDILIDCSPDEETLLSDAIGYTVAGFHTTGNLLTWAVYLMAKHPDVQEKVYEEVQSVLGIDTVDAGTINDLKYTHQVIDESLRYGVLAPYAARFQHNDSTLGGYHIPKDTPVIHALGVTLQDEKYWPEPNKFDPDRFTPENVHARPHMAFQPFGFAGKRICPGYRFAYAEAVVLLTTILKKFKIHLVNSGEVGKTHGLVTRPSEDIWITVSKRQ